MYSSEPHRSRLEILHSQLILRTLLGLIGAMVVLQTAKVSGVLSVDAKRQLIDFDAFYVAGQMVWRGEIDQAYHSVTMMRAERALTGADGFLPWAYPPQFNLLVASLALLPMDVAYLAFTGTTLVPYLAILRRIAGEHFGAVLLATFPAIIVTIATGQNGFLTGALIGWACLALLNHKPTAGVPLGLMVIKPHLMAAFALHVIATRRWTTILVAALVVALSTGIATFAFGPRIWTAFLRGAAEARTFLEAGYYPLYRMISSYAVLRTTGFSAPVAMAAHGVLALAILGMVWSAIRHRMPPTQVLGLTALASPLVSPYALDYDLTILGVALALLMPDLLRLSTRHEQAALISLSCFSCIWGLAQNTVMHMPGGAPASMGDVAGVSLAGATLLLLVALVWTVLQRDRVSAEEESFALPSAGGAV